MTAAYDARRDKLVLFGTVLVDWNAQWSNLQPTLWEWDSTNGWVSRVVQGTIERGCRILFDSQRGVVTRISGLPVSVAEWDGGNSWQTILPVTQPLPSQSATGYVTYDSFRGHGYVTLRDTSGYVGYSYGSVNPPRFEPLGAGCPGSLGEPALRLTKNWTRAWLGRSMSVDLTNLPLSAGFVAIGWSDQRQGAINLPLSLAPYGMPGCFARVALDLVAFVSGNNNAATLTLAIPSNTALVGAVLYQQGYSIDPGANAAGLTVSNSIRFTIGQL
jgi:hypothetical protein